LYTLSNPCTGIPLLPSLSHIYNNPSSSRIYLDGPSWWNNSQFSIFSALTPQTIFTKSGGKILNKFGSFNEDKTVVDGITLEDISE